MGADVNMCIDHPGHYGESRKVVGCTLRCAVADLNDPRTFDRDDGVVLHTAFAVENGSGSNGDRLLRSCERSHADERNASKRHDGKPGAHRISP
jgi:hypothetical protein